MTKPSKLMTMQEAISHHVPSGSMVLLGAQLEQMIPFAAGHELIRQGRKNLTLVGPISDILFDQMIGAGCVSRIMAAWVGNVSAGVGYCFRRAVELGVPRRIDMIDYSNFTMALALHAAAIGAPFLPTYATLGSDVLKKNGNLREFLSPVGEEYYGRDHAFFSAYHEESRNQEGFESWLGQWVTRPVDRAAYMRQLDPGRVDGLKVKVHAMSAPVDYGY